MNEAALQARTRFLVDYPGMSGYAASLILEAEGDDEASKDKLYGLLLAHWQKQANPSVVKTIRTNAYEGAARDALEASATNLTPTE